VSSATSKLQACKTVQEVVNVANAVLSVALLESPALRKLGGPASIESEADISRWLSHLNKAADSATADPTVFPSVYARLRAAVRRMQAIEQNG